MHHPSVLLKRRGLPVHEFDPLERDLRPALTQAEQRRLARPARQGDMGGGRTPTLASAPYFERHVVMSDERVTVKILITSPPAPPGAKVPRLRETKPTKGAEKRLVHALHGSHKRFTFRFERWTNGNNTFNSDALSERFGAKA